ncbi:DDE_Tnp_1_7 domain-containing protein [Trichonephila inaurata madagascariensis]|uniref:DDE_Tnp_1_7 domain-containing protein n=1 Tax=Trichonephila inaurata madagascariensis TaxID=2747483 RepID=A0A8X6XPQ4_9ARAC|nr:DDE_Tnp_1_7 domain-containing protein [Trichonephila inaurata madagascariensis]
MEYFIILGSDDGSEDSSEILQLPGSETEDSDDDGKIQNARSCIKINVNYPLQAPPRFQFSGDPKVLEEDETLEFFGLFMDRDLQELIVNEI